MNPAAEFRAIIVDDEELARQLIREYLWEAGGVEIVAECGNGFDAVKAVGELKPDLVFLDVQMPKLDGFEVLELMDPPRGDFRHRLRSVRHACLRCARGGLFAEALQRGPLRKALERARQRSGESDAAGAAELAAAARPPEQNLERIVVQGRRQGAHHSCGQARLCGSAGRLHRAAQREEELSEAADHFEPGGAARSGSASRAFTVPTS